MLPSGSSTRDGPVMASETAKKNPAVLQKHYKIFIKKHSQHKENQGIKVKVENDLLFMFSPPKISWVVAGIKYICLHLLPIFYLIQPSSKQIICFDF
jgi:hypothetical protein